MNKKISQFKVATEFNEQDTITIVQSGENKNITGTVLNATISESFATNERVDIVEDSVLTLDTKVNTHYADVNEKIVKGDGKVKEDLTSTVNSYYDILSNTIITLEKKHDADMDRTDDTMQGWIDDIDNRSTLQQLYDALNRLTIAENLITQLAELLANGGGGGIAPGFHTQGSNTIFPLSGYYYTGSQERLTTTDTLNQALSKLEGQIKSIEASTGGDTKYMITSNDNTQATDGNLYSALRSDTNYISAKYDDNASGYIKFLKGLQGGNVFRHGFLGEGASLYPVNGRWNMEVDDLFVRGAMTVNELIVNEIKATGGEILVSVADMKIIAVEVLNDGDFKCFFDTEDGTKYNKFRAGDQAICQIFDGKNVKRYWRLVKEAGSDYIILSLEVCEPGSGIPGVGDNLLQLGNRYPDGADRRGAIMISALGTDGPTITFYQNIDDFNLVNKDYTVIGKKSKFTGTLMQVNSNGDIYRVPVDRGAYEAGVTYYYYDRVSYQGSLWLCIAISTTTVPSKSNEAWLEQVSKGDAGAAGNDKAKWAEVIGERLFMYDNPKFEGTPKPAVLNLLCNTYNIEEPSYSWVNKNNNLEIGSQPNIEITPAMFGDSRNMLVRCTVTSGLETFYDETQLAKLGDGAQGADAYYVDLTNGNMSVPFDASGNRPLIDLSTVYTLVYAYYGTEPRVIQSITAQTVEGSATVKIENDKVTLTTLATPSARIRLSITVDNIVLTKDLWVNQVKNGEDGYDGTDAAYVMVNGEQLFRYDKVGIVSPAVIKLFASAYNINEPVYSWFWSVAGNNVWTSLTNEVGQELIVSPTGIYFGLSNNEITFRVDVTSRFGGTTYSDMITINKLYDGQDGISPYRATLSNESHTVPAMWNGTVAQVEINKAITYYNLYQGTKTLTAGSEYSVRYTNVQDNTANQLSHDPATKKLTLSRIGNAYDSTVFKVEFCVPANSNTVVDVVDFTVSKAKGGVPGDYEMTIYARVGSQPGAPTLTTMPSSGGSYSNGNYWYPDAPSAAGSMIWASTTLFDGAYGTTKSGSSWTYPVKISGKDGDTGEPGRPGADGRPGIPGAVGATGPTGPGLNFRGTYDPSKYYYWTDTLRDVVYNGGQYYAAKLPTITPGWVDSKWEAISSFAAIATGLLFAESATIAGWVFNNQFIYSLTNEAYLNGKADVWNPTIGIGINALVARTPKGSVTSSTELPTTGNAIGDAYWYNPEKTKAFGWTGLNWQDIQDAKLIPSAAAAIKIIKTGTISLGNGSNWGNAGISGEGNSSTSIRFWAGTSYGDSVNAPFRVYQDGSIVANKCSLTGAFSTSPIGGGSRAVLEADNYWGGALNLYDQSNLKLASLRGGAELPDEEGDTGPKLYMQSKLEISGMPAYSSSLTDSHIFFNRYTGTNSGTCYFGLLFDGGVRLEGKWPTISNAALSSGSVYKDDNGFLKVK